MAYFFIFIGGGLGSICRYGIAQLLNAQQWTFPMATLIANILSCLILGALIGLHVKGEITTTYKWMLMTGFCGGFSTFSTFSSETFLLLQSGEIAYAMANVGLSLVICLICIYLGLSLTMSH
jgi:CrcB protein